MDAVTELMTVLDDIATLDEVIISDATFRACVRHELERVREFDRRK